MAIDAKVFNVKDIGGIKVAPEDQAVGVTTTPTPIPDPFIHPEAFNIPSSYMGYAVTKIAKSDLGKAILKNGGKNVDLAGFEWDIKKSNVSDIEYSQIKPIMNGFIQGQLVQKGWVSGSTTVGAQTFSVNLSKSASLSEGYLNVVDGKVQVAIIEGNKNSAGNVGIKLFLSNVSEINSL